MKKTNKIIIKISKKKNNMKTKSTECFIAIEKGNDNNRTRYGPNNLKY